jgi:signal transduction histidine kinase
MPAAGGASLAPWAATVDLLHERYTDALALVAHELRSPASIVSGYLRLLQQDADGLTERQRRMTDEAGRACARMLRLIQEIGELANLEANEPVRASTDVAVFAVCAAALKSAAETAGSGFPAFTCADADRGAMVEGDAARLTMAFSALMAATMREHGTDPVECHGFVANGEGPPSAVIVCGPRGTAAAGSSLNAHREPFDRWRGGTGLSLPIACRLIESYGGCVWSPAGSGARASAWALPLARERRL